MNASLQGYAAAVFGELDASARGLAAEELGRLDQTISANHELRAALTDTSVPGLQRAAVLRQLLEGKVSAPVVRLAAYAAQVSHAQQVPASLSYLVSRARQAAAGEQVDEQGLGILSARERVGGFATAIFEDLEVGDLEEIEDELFRFARIVEGNPELRRALTDRDLPVALRQELVGALVEGKVSQPTLELLGYVVAGGRARDVVGTVDWLVDQTARARGWRVAKVRTAKALAETQSDGLKASLTRLVGHPVELQITEDATLLGGIRVEVGDLLVDATAKNRLAQLREHLDAEHKTFVKNA
jgi:F-type H+-transporting ATPase subunit delta